MVATKEYTDYVVTIWGFDERAFTDVHVQIIKNNGSNGKARQVSCMEAKPYIALPGDAPLPAIKQRSVKYLFEGYQDWAFSTKFAPWRKVNFSHPVKTVKELIRTKRIGHLHYKEPCNQVCTDCSKYQSSYPNCHPDGIEPLHFSRIHQPSGRLYGEAIELVQDPRSPNGPKRLVPGLLEGVTPRMLQNRIENGPKFYREQYKSYRFGIVQALGNKWIFLVVGGIAAIVFILYFTGNIPV